MTPTPDAIPGFLFIALGYIVLCAVSPYGNCRKCRGFGFHVSTDRRGRMKRGKVCRRCDGHGKRLRIGRWLYNLLVRIHRQGDTRNNAQKENVR